MNSISNSIISHSLIQFLNNEYLNQRFESLMTSENKHQANELRTKLETELNNIWTNSMMDSALMGRIVKLLDQLNALRINNGNGIKLYIKNMYSHCGLPDICIEFQLLNSINNASNSDNENYMFTNIDDIDSFLPNEVLLSECLDFNLIYDSVESRISLLENFVNQVFMYQNVIDYYQSSLYHKNKGDVLVNLSLIVSSLTDKNMVNFHTHCDEFNTAVEKWLLPITPLVKSKYQKQLHLFVDFLEKLKLMITVNNNVFEVNHLSNKVQSDCNMYLSPLFMLNEQIGLKIEYTLPLCMVRQNNDNGLFSYLLGCYDNNGYWKEMPFIQSLKLYSINDELNTTFIGEISFDEFIKNRECINFVATDDEFHLTFNENFANILMKTIMDIFDKSNTNHNMKNQELEMTPICQSLEQWIHSHDDYDNPKNEFAWSNFPTVEILFKSENSIKECDILVENLTQKLKSIVQDMYFNRYFDCDFSTREGYIHYSLRGFPVQFFKSQNKLCINYEDIESYVVDISLKQKTTLLMALIDL